MNFPYIYIYIYGGIKESFKFKKKNIVNDLKK
jgi:hypothetical protein